MGSRDFNRFSNSICRDDGDDMNTVLTPEEIEFNRRLDPRELLLKMGFDAAAIDEESQLFRLYCPIHKDQIRRSLIITKGENRFNCQFRSCPANKGGLLIELLALYLGVNVPEAIQQLAGEVKPEHQISTRADEEITQGHMDEALRLLEEAVRLTPRDEVTRCKLAAVCLELGQRDRGFREYLVAAEDFAVKNQVEKTLSIYNILILLSPQDMRVRRQLAFLFSRLDRHTEAIEHLKWVIDHQIARGETDEAIRTTAQVLEMAPAQADVRLLFARLLSQARRIHDAVAEAQAAAELAFENGDWKLADEAVTFGLFFHPQHERLRELETLLRQSPVPNAPAPVVASAEESAQESEFNDWLESLHDEITEKKPPGSAPLSAKESTVRRSEWLEFCRQTLGDLNNEKLNSMGQHLRSMFDDVEESFHNGTLTQWELNVLREFYTSFCQTYDQIRRERRTSA